MPTSNKLRWGVLSTANIGMAKVIPAMLASDICTVHAIASRDHARAQTAADKLGIPVAYGSYEELLEDSSISAIYNPLPNHMHLEWTLKAAEAGKHVLCEKPIGLNAGEAEQLVAARNRTGMRIQEAFMVRTHPQWLRTKELITSGRIGRVRSIHCTFSYTNLDLGNIRNQLAAGGGALMDIGCYPVNLSRFILDQEPARVLALIDRDPVSGIDRYISALLDYDGVQCTFTCSTQMQPYQRFQIIGTAGRVEVEIPVNAPPDRPTRIAMDTSGDLSGAGLEIIEIPVCDQYTIQADLFSQAILEDKAQPIALEDSIGNMRVIDALVRSAESSTWQRP